MRARHDHDLVVGGLQKKYEKEIKHLKETIDKLNEDLHDKVKVLEWKNVSVIFLRLRKVFLLSFEETLKESIKRVTMITVFKCQIGGKFHW